MLGAFAQTHSLDDQQIGVLASTELGGTFLATLSAVFWLRRVNWRKLMMLMLPIIILAFLGAGWCQNLTELSIVRFIGGVGHGAIYVVAVAYLCDSRNPERLVGFSISLQLLLAAAMFVLLPEADASRGLKGMMELLALIAATGFVSLIYFPSHGKFVAASPSEHPRRMGWPGLAVIAGMMMFQMSLASIWAYIELMAGNSGIAMETTGGILAITVPLAALGGVAAGLLGLRLGRALPLLLTAIVTIISLLILGRVASSQALFVGFLLQQFFWNFGIAYMFGMVAEFDTTGRLVPLAPSAQTLGNTLAPGLTGLALSGQGYLAVNMVSGVCACLSIVLLLLINWRCVPPVAVNK
jgi:MFS family permease